MPVSAKPSCCSKMLSRLTRRFSYEETGVVAIEFALIAPLLVALLLGTTSLTNSIWANGKVDHTANVIGDLVAQSAELDGAISGDQSLRTLMAAAPSLLAPFGSPSLSVTVTQAISCHVNPKSPKSEIKYFNVWSRTWSNGAFTVSQNYAHARALPVDTGNLRIAHDDFLIVTEVNYPHTPPIRISGSSTINMGEVAFHQPRDAAAVVFKPVTTENDITCADVMP